MAPPLARAVTRVSAGQYTLDDTGLPSRRVFPSPDLAHLDPFLQLHVTSPVEVPATGLPTVEPCLHRGFECATLVLQGSLVRSDANGHTVTLSAGDVGFSTEGTGSVHADNPGAGRFHAVTAWLNLPQCDRDIPPTFQRVHASAVPVQRQEDGATGWACVGNSPGLPATVTPRTPARIDRWVLPPGARVTVAIPAGHQGAVLALRGAVCVGEARTPVPEGSLAVLSDGERVVLHGPGGSGALAAAEALVLMGRPLGEPVSRYATLVAGSRGELMAAIQAYHQGMPRL